MIIREGNRARAEQDTGGNPRGKGCLLFLGEEFADVLDLRQKNGVAADQLNAPKRPLR